MSQELSDSAMEDILMTLPAVYQRASAFAYVFRLREQIRRLTDEASKTPAPVESPVDTTPRISEEETVKAIVTWIRDTNAADTVRANYARKLAERIEAGEYKA